LFCTSLYTILSREDFCRQVLETGVFATFKAKKKLLHKSSDVPNIHPAPISLWPAANVTVLTQ